MNVMFVANKFLSLSLSCSTSIRGCRREQARAASPSPEWQTKAAIPAATTAQWLWVSSATWAVYGSWDEPNLPREDGATNHRLL